MRRLLFLIALCCAIAVDSGIVTAAATAAASGPTTDALGIPDPAAAGGAGARADLPILTSWAVGGPALADAFCTGLGWHGGVFWVMGSDLDGDGVNGVADNGIYFYDQSGTFLGSFPQPTQDQWGWRDSGYEGSHFLLGASGVHAGQVFWVDVNTLAVEFQVSGCPWPTCRAIAITGASGGVVTYKVGDLLTDIATMDWTVGNNPAQLVGQCPTPGAAFGLAFDSGDNGLWVATADNTGNLFKIDAASCATRSVLNMLPEVQVFGGALMANTTHGCNLWTVCQCEPNDMVFGWASGGANAFACSIVAVEPATWGAVKVRYRD